MPKAKIQKKAEANKQKAEALQKKKQDQKNLENTLAALYNVVWGQCSKLLRNRLMAMENFESVESDCDVAMLLREIRRIGNQMDDNVSAYDALDEAKRRYYEYQQQDEDSNANHLINFKNLVAVVEHYGGDLFYDKAMVDYEKKSDVKLGLPESSEEEYITRVS